MVDSAQESNTTATDREILREYYLEKNFFTSTEGVLKVLAIVSCSASSVLWFARGGCAGRGPGAGGAGAAGAAGAALLAAQCAARALQLAARAPIACFYTDVAASACAGAWLLAAGALGLALCGAPHFVHGSLAIVNAALVVSSAVATYVSVTGRWDAARRPAPRPPRPPRPSRLELDV